MSDPEPEIRTIQAATMPILSMLCTHPTKGEPVASIAFFATEKPIPGQHYTGIPVAGKTIFIRTVDVTEGESADPINNADDAALRDETLLNTYETDE